MKLLVRFARFDRVFLIAMLLLFGVALAPSPVAAKGNEEFCFCGSGFCDPGTVLCCSGEEFRPPCECFAISPTRCG